MDRRDVDWKGLWPASVTPFTADGDLDTAAWRELLALHHELGMQGLLVNGSSGEWFSQTEAERRQVAQIAVEELRGKLPVVIGCTHFRPDWVIELAQHAESVGADGVMIAPPPYARLTMDDIVAFFEQIAARVRIPIMVYNMPPAVAVDIDTRTVVRLSRIDRVVAIKDSTPNQTQFLATLQEVIGTLRVFGLFMTRLGIAVMSEIGGDGQIHGGAVFGKEEPEFFNAFWRGDLVRAREIADKVNALNSWLWTSDWYGRFGTSQSQMKAIMQLLGQPGGWPRPPLRPITDPSKLEELRAALASAGLLPATAAKAAQPALAS